MAKKSCPKNAGPVSTVGIDLAKNSFHIHGTDDKGHTVINQKISRKRLPQVIAQLSQYTIAMEACGSAHYWARVFSEFGHEIKLIAPQFVKNFVKPNKNYAADAEAISEAAQRPNMRFVSPKSIEQQDIQSIHRMRVVWRFLNVPNSLIKFADYCSNMAWRFQKAVVMSCNDYLKFSEANMAKMAN